jgi:5,10-methylenetetrahydromethanopterin reductase
MGETAADAQVWTHGFAVPGQTGNLARRAEDSGFDGLLLADSQNLAGDPFVELGVAAGVTHRIGLGTGIVNLVTRHPAVVAAAIASVQVESGGRAVLGVGRGDSSLAQIGLAAPPVARLRDLVTQVRGYLRGAEVEAGGTVSRIGWIAETGLPAVPVEVAATGPRTIAFAATPADRVMFTVGAEPSRVAWAIGVARQARAAAGLDPAGLSMGAYVNVACDPDVTAACALIRGSAAIFAHFSSMPGPGATDSGGPGPGAADSGTNGFSPREAATVREVGLAYDESRHGLSHAAHAAVLDDSFLTRFAVAGPPEECLARLRQLTALGLDRIVVVPGSRDADPARLARSDDRFARQVLPALRGAQPAARSTNTPQPR